MARWWEHPKLWPDESQVGERKVGFIDLFYDLIFVVAIAQIAHGFSYHMDLHGLIDFVLLALPVFWIWMGHTFYVDRFENRDLSHVLYTFGSMLPVLGLAVFAHGGRADTAVGFTLSYAAARLLLTFMWARAAVHNPEGRDVWTRLAVGFGIGAAFWVVAAFVDEPYRTALQVTGLVWDLAIPSFVAKGMVALPKFAEHRLRERFGLIMIIVLGESVAGTANGLAGLHHIDLRLGVLGLLAMTLAFGVYFTYFEMVPRERIGAGLWKPFGRTYVHFPLMLAITATGASVLAAVGHEHEVLDTHVRWAMGGSIATAYISMVGLSRCHEYQEFGAGRKGTEGALWAGALLALAVAVFGEGLGTMTVIAAMTVASAVPWLVGVNAWRRFTKHQPKKPELPTSG